jgi:hypothetical protein
LVGTGDFHIAETVFMSPCALDLLIPQCDADASGLVAAAVAMAYVLQL